MKLQSQRPVSVSAGLTILRQQRGPAAALLLLLAAVAMPAARAEVFTDNFSGGLDPRYFTTTQTTPGLFSENATQGSVQLAKVSVNTGGEQNIVVSLNLQTLGAPANGDFSVSIDFSNAVVGPNVDQVELRTYYADSSAFFDVYDTSGGLLNVHVSDGTSVNNPTSVSGNSGTFLITRTGATVTGAYNGKAIFSRSITAALTQVAFALQIQAQSNDNTAVQFDNLAVSYPPGFFAGQVSLGSGVYYLAFPSGADFGYYSFLSDPDYLYHFDLGYEYIFDAEDGQNGVYLYDFKSGHFFYTSPGFGFPFLYDFTLNSVLYYYPDPNDPGRYNTNGVRYFYDFNTQSVIAE